MSRKPSRRNPYWLVVLTTLLVAAIVMTGCGGAKPAPAATEPPAKVEEPVQTEEPVKTAQPAGARKQTQR